MSLVLKIWNEIKIKIDDQKRFTINKFQNSLIGSGSWNALKNVSIYPVNKKGFILSKIGIGINVIAVPINTTLIVIIMGVTLFLEIVEIRKHKHDTDIITRVDKRKARKNRQIISSSASSNNPLWNTAKSPIPSHNELANKV